MLTELDEEDYLDFFCTKKGELKYFMSYSYSNTLFDYNGFIGLAFARGKYSMMLNMCQLNSDLLHHVYGTLVFPDIRVHNVTIEAFKRALEKIEHEPQLLH